MGYLMEIANNQVPTQMVDSKLKDTNSLSVQMTRGEFVAIPFRQGYYSTNDSSGATTLYQEGVGVSDNEDGSGSCVLLTVPSGIGNGARLRFAFYGRTLGLRFRRDSATPDFSVLIDGVAYGVSGKHTFLANDNASVTDGESHVIVANDLTDGVHYADVVLVAPSTGSVTLYLYGYLAEKRAGYQAKPRLQFVYGVNNVPTTSTNIPKGSSTTNTLKGISKIQFYNTTASAITITIQYNANTIWSKSIPANSSDEWNLGGLTSLPSGAFTYQASATGLNALIIGGY